MQEDVEVDVEDVEDVERRIKWNESSLPKSKPSRSRLPAQRRTVWISCPSRRRTAPSPSPQSWTWMVSLLEKNLKKVWLNLHFFLSQQKKNKKMRERSYGEGTVHPCQWAYVMTVGDPGETQVQTLHPLQRSHSTPSSHSGHTWSWVSIYRTDRQTDRMVRQEQEIPQKSVSKSFNWMDYFQWPTNSDDSFQVLLQSKPALKPGQGKVMANRASIWSIAALSCSFFSFSFLFFPLKFFNLHSFLILWILFSFFQSFNYVFN